MSLALKFGLKLIQGSESVYQSRFLVRCMSVNVDKSFERNPRARTAVDLLDDPVINVDLKRPAKERSKTSRPLRKLAPEPVDKRKEAQISNLSNQIKSIMNSTLASKIFLNKFRGVEKGSDLFKIEIVTTNRDASHAYAHWRSEPIEKYLKQLEFNKSIETLQRGEKLIKKTTENLQSHESKFRSSMIKVINLRRVPRIYFKHSEAIQVLLDNLKNDSFYSIENDLVAPTIQLDLHEIMEDEMDYELEQMEELFDIEKHAGLDFEIESSPTSK